MEEYRSNSDRSREQQSEQRKIEKVVNGNVVSKKKSGFSKFVGAIAPDDTDSLKDHILGDYVIPGIKDIILDTVKACLGMSGSSSRDSRQGRSSRISYSQYYNNGRYTTTRPRTMSGYDYDDIILSNRGEAEAVLNRMDEIVAEYGNVSVADFYDLVGVVGSYTDNKYGWVDIRSARVERVRDGYMIRLPKALPL